MPGWAHSRGLPLLVRNPNTALVPERDAVRDPVQYARRNESFVSQTLCDVMPAVIPAPIPPPLLDTLLHQAPLDVLLFDTDLICRYAAPADDTLFGRAAHELIGLSADEVFPPAGGDLGPALQLAARNAATYENPSYRYTFEEAQTRTLFCWSVRIQSVALRDYRGREEFRGVLVTLADVQDLADTNDRLTAEIEALRRERGLLRRQLDAAQQRVGTLVQARRHLQSAVRNQLTPVIGYLQLLYRRPQQLNGQPAAAVIETHVLPGLRRVVEELEQAEAGTRGGERTRDPG